MKAIWYLLKCREGNETDYAQKCLELVNSDALDEIVCFQYQRLMRYGGKWHMEKRIALPGCIFLSGAKAMVLQRNSLGKRENEQGALLIPCEAPYLKGLCQNNGTLIEISRGIIRNGVPVIISGPLKGREGLIRKVDRHKRTAEIEIPFAGNKKQVTVGLEIYKKEV